MSYLHSAQYERKNLIVCYFLFVIFITIVVFVKKEGDKPATILSPHRFFYPRCSFCDEVPWEKKVGRLSLLSIPG
jgi:hypothetical protein